MTASLATSSPRHFRPGKEVGRRRGERCGEGAPVQVWLSNLSECPGSGLRNKFDRSGEVIPVSPVRQDLISGFAHQDVPSMRCLPARTGNQRGNPFQKASIIQAFMDKH